MSKLNINTLAKKKENPVPSQDEIINAAPVSSNVSPTLDPNERRGTKYKDPTTGKIVKLNGKNKEVTLNAYEYSIIEKAALNEGVSVATFMRVYAIKSAKLIISSM